MKESASDSWGYRELAVWIGGLGVWGVEAPVLVDNSGIRNTSMQIRTRAHQFGDQMRSPMMQVPFLVVHFIVTDLVGTMAPDYSVFSGLSRACQARSIAQASAEHTC